MLTTSTCNTSSHSLTCRHKRPSPYTQTASSTMAAVNEDSGDLRFEDVSFTYPGTEKEVLSGINLTVPPGQFIALVGANGSGKTSLIKLLSRLYNPTSGRITYNGVDLEEVPTDLYRANVSVLFQDYAHYADTLHENIRFGDIASPCGRPEIIEAARFSGAHDFATTLPSGYDTRLTRIFDNGVELSIGQWQKVAMARAFYRRSRILVMDEPTSALDPIAEAELFDRFSATALEIAPLLSSVTAFRPSATPTRSSFWSRGESSNQAPTPSFSPIGGYTPLCTICQGRHFQQ